MNSIILAARSVLTNYSTFSGRASRSEFWWWVFLLMILLNITRLIDNVVIRPLLGFDVIQSINGQPLSLLVSLALLLPSIAVTARRLHDIGRSAWWLLIGLLPFIGTIMLLYFYVQPSDGNNAYGTPSALGEK